MALDNIITSPHRRSQSQTAFSPPLLKKQVVRVTLGAGNSCSGLRGAQKASCHLQQAKASVAKGKLKFF